MKTRHIYPLGDGHTHYNTVRCACMPFVREENDELIVLHQSFDNREIIVEAEVVIGARCSECLHHINEKGKRVSPPPLYQE